MSDDDDDRVLGRCECRSHPHYGWFGGISHGMRAREVELNHYVLKCLYSQRGDQKRGTSDVLIPKLFARKID